VGHFHEYKNIGNQDALGDIVPLWLNSIEKYNLGKCSHMIPFLKKFLFLQSQDILQLK